MRSFQNRLEFLPFEELEALEEGIQHSDVEKVGYILPVTRSPQAATSYYEGGMSEAEADIFNKAAAADAMGRQLAHVEHLNKQAAIDTGSLGGDFAGAGAFIPAGSLIEGAVRAPEGYRTGSAIRTALGQGLGGVAGGLGGAMLGSIGGYRGAVLGGALGTIGGAVYGNRAGQEWTKRVIQDDAIRKQQLAQMNKSSHALEEAIHNYAQKEAGLGTSLRRLKLKAQMIGKDRNTRNSMKFDHMKSELRRAAAKQGR